MSTAIQAPEESGVNLIEMRKQRNSLSRRIQQIEAEQRRDAMKAVVGHCFKIRKEWQNDYPQWWSFVRVDSFADERLIATTFERDCLGRYTADSGAIMNLETIGKAEPIEIEEYNRAWDEAFIPGIAKLRDFSLPTPALATPEAVPTPPELPSDTKTVSKPKRSRKTKDSVTVDRLMIRGEK